MEESKSRKGWCMTLKLLSSGLGIVMGLSVFFTFTFHYKNLHAGVWGLVSSIFAAKAFHLFLLHRTLRLTRWHTPLSLSVLRCLGILGIIAGGPATVYYWYTAISQQEDFHEIGDSHTIDGVWSFMTFKWSVALALSSHKYKAFWNDNSNLITPI